MSQLVSYSLKCAYFLQIFLSYSELSITRIPITRISLKLERFRRPQELPTKAFDSLLLKTLYNSNGFHFSVDIRVIKSSLYDGQL